MRETMRARLHRMGIRWGVVNGARMTAQFPALGLPPKRIVLPDDEAA
jgi:predicted cobalt transporter CbtA